MASFSYALFIVHNLLDELKLNPVWERYRRIGFTVCITSSFICMYLSFNLSVHCEPASSNGSVRSDVSFSEPTAERINSFCRNDFDVSIGTWGGWCLFALNLETLFFSSYWLHYRRVIDMFRTIAKARDLIVESNMTLDKIKDIMQSSSQDIDGWKMINDSKMLLQLPSKTDLRKHYFYRNVTLLTHLTLAIASSVVITIFVAEIDDSFVCKGDWTTANKNYICAQSFVASLLIATISYSLGMLFQMWMVAWSINVTAGKRIYGKVAIMVVSVITAGGITFELTYSIIVHHKQVTNIGISPYYLVSVILVPVVLPCFWILPRIFPCWRRKCRCCLKKPKECQRKSAEFVAQLWEHAEPLNSAVFCKAIKYMFPEEIQNATVAFDRDNDSPNLSPLDV